MKAQLFLLLLLFGSGGVLAQRPGTEPGSAVLQSCLLGTSPDVWNTLKLTSDQIRRMGHIQEACKVECDGAGVPVVHNPISNADGETVMAEVRNVLSTDQYNAWVAYCTQSGTDNAAPE